MQCAELEDPQVLPFPEMTSTSGPSEIDGWLLLHQDRMRRRWAHGCPRAEALLRQLSLRAYISGLAYVFPCVGQGRALRVLRQEFGWNARECRLKSGMDLLPLLFQRSTDQSVPVGWRAFPLEAAMAALTARFEEAGLRVIVGRHLNTFTGGARAMVPTQL